MVFTTAYIIIIVKNHYHLDNVLRLNLISASSEDALPHPAGSSPQTCHSHCFIFTLKITFY